MSISILWTCTDDLWWSLGHCPDLRKDWQKESDFARKLRRLPARELCEAAGQCWTQIPQIAAKLLEVALHCLADSVSSRWWSKQVSKNCSSKFQQERYPKQDLILYNCWLWNRWWHWSSTKYDAPKAVQPRLNDLDFVSMLTAFQRLSKLGIKNPEDGLTWMGFGWFGQHWTETLKNGFNRGRGNINIFL